MKTISAREWILLAISLVLMILVLTDRSAGSERTEALAQAPVVTVVSESKVPEDLEDNEIFLALERLFIEMYEEVSPSVVHVTNRSYGMMFGRRVPQGGTGSGFVYDDEGHIITNYHVVEDAEALLVSLADGQEYEAELIGADPLNDLAIVRIDAGADLPEPLPIIGSSEIRVGQIVIAIGNPFGLQQTLTTGVVSALERVIDSPQDNRFIGEVIQTDAAINPGNSGGPLLDLRGRVVGVNSQIISPSGGNSGIGFAVSSNTVQRVVPELIEHGYYAHPWIGASLFELSPATAETFREADMDLPVNHGLLILEALAGQPAFKAGLVGSETVRFGNRQLPLGGDVIVAINGEPIRSFQHLTVFLETRTSVGESISVTIIHDGEEVSFDLILGKQPRS